MAAITTGQIGTYNQTVGLKLDMDEAIQILPVWDVPLQQELPMGPPATAKKIEWLEDELTPQEVTVDATSALASSTIVLVANDGTKVRVGDVLIKKDGTVQAHVTAISTDTLTVTRPFAGSTDEALSANDVLQLISQYRDEGSDPVDGRSVDRSTAHNLTQIDQEKVEVTRTERKRALYGVSDPYDYEVQKKFKELAIRFERRLIHSRRIESGDAKKRAMGGLFYYITTNTQSGVKANLEAETNALVKKCYEKGGTPTWLVVSPALSTLYNALRASQVSPANVGDQRAGIGRQTVFSSDFGDLNITVDRHMPKTKALVLQKDYIKQRDFDPYFHELLAKTGDAEKGHIVAEKTLEVKNEEAGGVLTITDA